MREVLLIIHILAAATWIGTNMAQFALTPVFRADGSMATWRKATLAAGTRLYGPAAVLILITGVWLVIDSSFYEFEHTFVVIGIAVVVLGAVLGGAVFGRQERAVADLYAQGEEAKAAPIEKRLMAFGLFDTALLILAVAAMVGKWGA